MRAFRFLVVALFVMNTSIAAQWLKHPTADIPRTADGKPDLAAPTPRQPNGRPVLAGLWRPAPGLVGDMTRGLKAVRSSRSSRGPRHFSRSGARTTAATIRRRAASSVESRAPTSSATRSRFSSGPEMVVILYEAVHSYRQIFTDGRTSPRIRTPTGLATRLAAGRATFWSSSRAGSTTTSGWTTPAGPATEMLKVTERFVRKNFGQMDIEITIDDPKAYTKPWSVTQQLAFQPDTELLEYICNENNKYLRDSSRSFDGR